MPEIIEAIGQFSECAPGKYPVLNRNSFTTTAPVNLKYCLNKTLHSLLFLGCWDISQFENPPWDFRKALMTDALYTVASIFNWFLIIEGSLFSNSISLFVNLDTWFTSKPLNALFNCSHFVSIFRKIPTRVCNVIIKGKNKLYNLFFYFQNY